MDDYLNDEQVQTESGGDSSFALPVEIKLSWRYIQKCAHCGRPVQAETVIQYAWTDRKGTPASGFIANCRYCGSRVLVPDSYVSGEKKWNFRKLAPIVLVVVLVLVVLYAAHAVSHTKVENYVGLEIGNAVSDADDTLEISQVGRIISDSEDYGVVLEQSIDSGTTVEKNSEITLTYGVPDFEGMSWSEASELAEDLGIDMNKSSFTVSSSNVGTVSSATYGSSGTSVSVTVVVPDFEGMSWSDACDLADEQEIDIMISSCTESSSEVGTILSAKYNSSGNAASVEVAIPDLAGMDKDTAVSQLKVVFDEAEIVEETTEYSDSVGKGKIIDYDISSDGSSLSLSLTVSEGPEYVTVPDLAGMTPEEAEEALEAVGLVYAASDYSYYSTYDAGCVAFIYYYDVGETVKQGTTIWVAPSKAKIEHSGLISSNKSEITLTQGGGSVSLNMTTSSSMGAGIYWGTDDYNFSSNWADKTWILTVSANENAVSGWIQVAVWPSKSSRDGGDPPSDFVNIRVYVDS